MENSWELLENAGFRVTTVDEEIDLPKEILLKAGPADYDLPVVFVCRITYPTVILIGRDGEKNKWIIKQIVV